MKRYKQDHQLPIFELVKKVTQLQVRKLQLLQLQILFVSESLGREAKIWSKLVTVTSSCPPLGLIVISFLKQFRRHWLLQC